MVARDRDIAQAAGFIAPPGYGRHRPETTLLYQLVAEHYPRFRDRRVAEERPLPRYVEDEFEAYLKCGLLKHGFLRVKCESCQAEKLVAFSCKRRGFCPSCGARRMTETAALLVDEVLPLQPVRQWVLSLPFALRYLLATRPDVVTQVLGIVYRAISGHLIRKAGLKRASAATGAVTLIQRFGSALNLNVHFHMLVLDGVYCRDVAQDRLQFVPVPAPSTAELKRLVQRMAERIGRSLERSGLITRDIENAYLAFDPGEEAPINALLGHSITYRIATGPREGQKVFTLQTLPAEPAGPRREVAESSGFSLHAGIAAKASQRDKLEHLARYVSRPPVATERLSLTEGGQVRCALKTAYRDGTTHVIFEPEDFIARLAALVPKPRAHLTRYHGVFAPASPDRARVVPGTRSAAANKAKPCGEPSATDRQRALTWAQRLKRVFAIDIEVCRRCGGRLRVIASIEDPAVIERILEHLGRDGEPVDPAHPSRAPPEGELSL
jgi:Putative transposase/Transposase zinc-binding domain